MAVSVSDKIVRSGEPVWAPAGEEIVMLSVEKGKYFGLNEIAAAIWERIEHPIEVKALCNSLREIFDVSPEQCEAEVLPFLNQMLEKGLIRVSD